MESILEELYYGNIRPASRTYGQNSTFVQTARLKSKSAFTSSLDTDSE